MAEFKKAKVVDGYSLVRAMAHKAESDPESRPRILPAGAARPPAPGAAAGGAKRTVAGVGSGSVPVPPVGAIGKTIQPTRRTIRCFDCGYEFQLSGTVGAIYCSKCRAKINLGDVTVSDVQRDDIRTGGTVHILPGAVIAPGVKVMAGNVIIEGRLESGASVSCTQWLQIGPGAQATARQLETRNLRIAAGASIQIPGKLAVQHLEVLGKLEADVEASGLVSLRAGGHLCGVVRGHHLQVEEGAALEARMFIWGPERPS